MHPYRAQPCTPNFLASRLCFKRRRETTLVCQGDQPYSRKTEGSSCAVIQTKSLPENNRH
jgi:hypothetical protein